MLFAVIRAPVVHPLKLVTALIQFGYEPASPTRKYSFLVRRYFYYYPGFIGYCRCIANERGWRSLYRGVVPAIIEDVAGEMANDLVRPLVGLFVNSLPLKEVPGDETPDNVDNLTTTRATLVRATKGFLTLSVTNCLVEVLIHPFHVVTVRTMAQHVGQESMYNGFITAIKEIYNSDGIRGFYAGIVPSLIYHVVNSLAYEVVVVVVEETAKRLPFAIVSGGVAILKGPLASYVTRSYTYSFQLIRNLMIINGTPLQAASLNPQFFSWKDCWKYLRATGNLFRGYVVLLPRIVHNDPRNKI